MEIDNHLFDPVIVMYSDASSKIGGGAWLTYDGVEILNERFIRWTREELEMFIQHLVSSTLMKHVGVSISVLENFYLFYSSDDRDTRSEAVM